MARAKPGWYFKAAELFEAGQSLADIELILKRRSSHIRFAVISLKGREWYDREIQLRDKRKLLGDADWRPQAVEIFSGGATLSETSRQLGKAVVTVRDALIRHFGYAGYKKMVNGGKDEHP